jgi:hypothetical protein
VVVARVIYLVATAGLLAGAVGIALLPILAPTVAAFLMGGIFLVGGMLIAWIVIEAIPGFPGRPAPRLRIRFAFLVTAPPVAVWLLVHGDWFGAIWPGLLFLGALLRSLELLLTRARRSGPSSVRPPFIRQ